MPDVVTQARRSEIMSHIKSKDTSIELLVRKRLHRIGYRFRVNYKLLPGKPDIAFTKKCIAIFIHGCFWHGHNVGCRYSHIPQSRKDYWEAKLSRTKERDEEHLSQLKEMGWTTLVIWECEIKNDLDVVIERIINVIEKHD